MSTIIRLTLQTIIAIWFIYTEWGNYLAWGGVLILIPTIGNAQIAYKRLAESKGGFLSMSMLKKFDSSIYTCFKKATIFIEQYSPIAVMGFIIYCLVKKIPLSYDGLNLFITNCDLTQLIIVSLLLLFPTVLFMSGETTIGIIMVIGSLFFYFSILAETNRFIILMYGLATPLRTFIDVAFWSMCWLYDKYCKDTAWDRFVSRYLE